MIDFLLKRPIATGMTFIALFLLGIVSYQRLPVSLLPDIDIPEVTVLVYYPKYTAREMEKRVASVLRRNLQQCAGLNNITSESHNGHVNIKLQFEHGMDIDLAAIEVNEKIDRQVQRLPKDMARPTVIKASAADIPVFYLNMSLKDHDNSHNDFLELSRFSEQVIKKRLEQISEVGFVDMSGIDKPQVSIIPDMEKIEGYGLNMRYIENVIKSNNFTIGNIVVNEGYYQYHIRISSPMLSIKEIRNLRVLVNGRIMLLKDLATISLTARKKTGFFMDGSKDAISMAVIKQADAKMQDLKNTLQREVERITKDFPTIRFDIAQDQTALLEISIANLRQTLMYGAFLSFIVLFLFIPNWQLPLLMVVTVPVSLVISVLFLMFFNISINIISLSGLVLGIGLMIDNAIIVLDNITQHETSGKSVFQSCLDATNEVIKPLLSSALTTSAVFVPLVFIGGISGALFYDQAVTVTVSLFISFVVSITLLPVMYQIAHRRRQSNAQPSTNASKKPFLDAVKYYNRAFNFVFCRKGLFTLLFVLLIPLSVFLFQIIDKQSFPTITQQALIAEVNWNESLSTDEIKRRITKINEAISLDVSQMNTWSGTQDYILNNEYDLRNEESKLFLNCTTSPDDVHSKIKAFLQSRYPKAEAVFSFPENLFTKTFAQAEAPLILMMHPTNTRIKNDSLLNIITTLDALIDNIHINTLGQYSFINLSYDREMLLLYHVAENDLLTTMKVAFNENEIGMLNTANEVIPILVGTARQTLTHLLQNTFVPNSNGLMLPIKHFVKATEEMDFEVVYGSKKGVYLPVHYDATIHEQQDIEQAISQFIRTEALPFNISWAGGLYDKDNNIKEISVVLLISVMLLYFILAIQFESLLQPLIILLEIPMDLSGSLLLLMLLGGSLNIMSAIGIVVMTGIIINDSILKLDTINRLYRKERMRLLEAIHEAGVRRIRPILMTSVTTILALAPFLFTSGMGAELQTPMALAIIGGLWLGTLVSLYFIPLCYWWIYHNKEK